MRDPPGFSQPNTMPHLQPIDEAVPALIHRLKEEESLQKIDTLLQQLFPLLNQENIISTLQSISTKPLLLEFLLASFPNQIALRVWLRHLFPHNATTFGSSSISHIILRLSNFFLLNHDLPVPVEYSAAGGLPTAEKLVSRGPYALNLLSEMTFGNDWDMLALPKHKGKGHKKSMSWREEAAPKRSFDPAILSDFGLDLPCNARERDHAATVVLTSLKDCLLLYFFILSHPDVAGAVKTRFQAQLPALNSQNEEESTTNIEQAPEVASNFIQPMSAARHFSNVEGFGDWRILISTRADGDLREASRKNRKMFKIYVKKIRELSNGHFSSDNQKRLTGPNHEIPVYEAKMTGDTRLVYQVDCISDYDSEAETQVVRIFGIYTHAQMDDRLWHSVGSQLSKRGKEYRKRCNYRQKAEGGESDLYAPATFPRPPEVEEVVQTIPDLPPDDLEQILLEKYLDFSHELLQSILANLDVSFPFQVSPHEKEIIEHPDSCYVLGRSGTGKTTTMLFKMLWVEKAYEVNKDGMPRPRQIFVTKSRVLARKVEESFTKLLASLRIEAKPLRELQTHLKREAEIKSEDLVDVDDEANWRADLPKRFSELEDHHFPLFLTFDHLCDMVEGDADTPLSPNLSEGGGSTSPFITFEQFRYQYWPHFPQSLTKGLDPALVFSEIIGIIKGSEDTLSTEGILTRQVYETLSERSYSTFASQRSIIYSIFETYQAQKRQRGERDNADRTHTLLRLIKANGVKGKKIDQLYVDEAQDNLLIDALVLRSLSHNSNGLFWAGDTAQTISVGSSFRFDDLKAFLFRIEQQRSRDRKYQLHSTREPKPPKAFQLVTNYRSHGGIVNCAHSVIELVTKFWPYSIDNLQPEQGIVDGPKPLFLIRWDNDNVRYEQFLFGSSGSPLEFGAQQCILVRDEAARVKLQEQVGEIGLIMTLYESKGLEFNDVLLFNFFEDSACDLSQWRLILNEINGSRGALAPRFDPLRHAPICFELKFLYVALTRARKNLWIADKSLKGDPMRMYWSSRGQIKTCTPADKIPQLADVSSSTQEWALKGQELFRRKRYLQAKYCFDRAKQPWEAAVSEAYLSREEARKIPVTTDSKLTLQKRRQAFCKAAEAFITCSLGAPKNKSVYILRAAECFEQAGEELRAARAYLDAKQFDTAAKLFRKLGRFDDAVDIIKHHSQRMDQAVVETLKEVARLYYFREEQLAKARDLFATDEEELEYLEDLDLDLARADVLESLGRCHEAARLHVAEGRTLSAIPLFLKDAGNPESAQEAKDSLLCELWRGTTIGHATTLEASTSTLLQWLEEIPINQSIANDQELIMFRTLLKSKHTMKDVQELADRFLTTGNIPAALLCLDQHFSAFPSPKLQSIQELGETLSTFFSYIRILQDIAFRPHLFDTAGLGKLFGCKPTIGDTFSISPGTLLYLHRQAIRQPTKHDDTDISISKSELYHILRIALCNRLQERVSKQAESCRRAAQFSSCLNWAVGGFCNRGGCHSEHVSVETLTPEHYNGRVRLHLLQVLIHQVWHSTNADYVDVRRQKRNLLNQFYDILFPSHYCLGTPEYLSPSSIPEWSRGIQVVRDWIRELAYNLDLGGGEYALTHLVKGTRLSFYFDGLNAPLYWSVCARQHIPEALLRPPAPKFSIPWDIICCTEVKQPYSLSMGILAFRHIVSSRLPIHPGALCDMVESLCASIAISHRFRPSFGYYFHGLVLPRSWMPRILLDTMIQPSMSLHHMLVDNVAELLEIIYTGNGADFLLFEGSNLAYITSYSVRAVFIIRLIRAICILGYNIRNYGLRNNILRSISSLRRVERRFPPLYRQFTECRHWDHIAHAVRNMTQGALSDGLMQLHDLRQSELPSYRISGITLMGYRNESDLQIQLTRRSTAVDASVPDTGNSGEPQVNIPVEEISAPQAPGLSEVAVEVMNGETPSSNDSEAPHRDWDDADPGIVDNVRGEEGEVEMLITNPSQEHKPSEEEIRTAKLIQTRYRQMIRQRADRDLKGLAAARHGLFSRCLKCAGTTNWDGHSLYQRMFLGPLPHILLCLETTMTALTSEKTKAKKRLLSGTHQELDALGPQLTRLQNSHKSLKRLQSLLDPSSDVHKARKVAELKRLVQESNNELRSLPIPLPQEIAGDLVIGFKGIVTERKVKIPENDAKPKPSLVIDDDYDILY